MTQTTLQNPVVSLQDHLVVILVIALALAMRSWVSDPPTEVQVSPQTELPAPAEPQPLDVEE